MAGKYEEFPFAKKGNKDRKLFDNPEVRKSYEKARKILKEAGLIGRYDLWEY